MTATMLTARDLKPGEDLDDEAAAVPLVIADLRMRRDDRSPPDVQDDLAAYQALLDVAVHARRRLEERRALPPIAAGELLQRALVAFRLDDTERASAFDMRGWCAEAMALLDELRTLPSPTTATAHAAEKRRLEDEVDLAVTMRQRAESRRARAETLTHELRVEVADLRVRLDSAAQARNADVLDRIVRWQAAAFPAASLRGAVKHLERELREVDRELEKGDLQKLRVELVDAAFLAIHGYTLAGGTDFGADLAEKLRVNEGRSWQKPDADGCIEHDRARDDDVTAPHEASP